MSFRSLSPTRRFTVGLLMFTATTAHAQQLVGLEVTGPTTVAENFHAKYTATALFDNNTTRDVTAAATWMVEPAGAGSFATPGNLTTAEIGDTPVRAVISATYKEQGVVVVDEISVTIVATGGAGNALQFDGVDDVVEIPQSNPLSFGTQASFEFWLRVNQLPSGGSGHWILVRGANQQASFNCSLDANAHIAVEFYLDNQVQAVILGYGVTAPTSQWLHIAATIDTAIPLARLYVDGEVVGETARLSGGAPIPPEPIRNTALPTMIGGLPPHANNYTDGSIDELRIWDVARRQEEIWGAMYRRLRGDEPGLVGYWRVDEGDGQTIRDASPFGNDGFLGSDPTNPDSADPAWIMSNAPVGPPPVLGDLNCDGRFNGADIDPFFQVLGDTARYILEFPHCDFMLADINGDGFVNGADIDPFFLLLGGG